MRPRRRRSTPQRATEWRAALPNPPAGIIVSAGDRIGGFGGGPHGEESDAQTGEASAVATAAAPAPAAQPAKSSAPAWYGIVIDGKRVPYTLPSVAEAEAAAIGLREQGHKVAIYDQDTNQVVKRL